MDKKTKKSSLIFIMVTVVILLLITLPGWYDDFTKLVSKTPANTETQKTTYTHDELLSVYNILSDKMLYLINKGVDVHFVEIDKENNCVNIGVHNLDEEKEAEIRDIIDSPCMVIFESDRKDVFGILQFDETDVNGNTAADVVRMYYEALNDDTDEMSYFVEAYRDRDIKEQDISLVELSACEIVKNAGIRESDKEWAKEIEEDYYAYCFVQTSDRIIYEGDSAEGEVVFRNYSYTLVMETEDSEWQIYDFGYPPHYIIWE